MGVESITSGSPPGFDLFLEQFLSAIFASQLLNSKKGVLLLVIIPIQTLVANISQIVNINDTARLCLLHGRYGDLGVSSHDKHCHGIHLCGGGCVHPQ